MARAIFALAFLASASAFAPSVVRNQGSVQLNAKSKSMPFMECPPKLDGSMVGDVGFDPLGISNTVNDMKWLRAAELKNGRVAQLAILGMIIQEQAGWHDPGAVAKYAGYAELNPLAAPGAVPVAANIQIFLMIACTEIIQTNKWYGDGEPGDMGWGSKMLEGKTKAQVDDMKLKELTHCRLAMMAFAGAITQTLLFQTPLLGGSF
mmetsp:Transcript_13747/g.32575  ORF Transcript_13747/g.32575 Transcript_13747/m.32575 type:complete len:206 (+) Transcript_13747:69-686(+)|eukprot:CAMPEP_0172587660 /NCGR_PEP_ID=MMETSP1068-20121228/6671_1 /TAXON_ID=35684 /ORGANISM="Pseudopedinella elastica, Strain CCMP716" /LENGTH=205 /DNA_ID=CAMNT_0013382741 /DNA_START=46 /DNA_END=663 /DNA_ORIENTATION=-